MSSIKLESNASGTGIFTLASPATNTNRTLTLPDNTGTILTSATTTGFPAGSVIQVVQSVKTDTFSSASTSSVDITGMSVSITPSSSTSKILVCVNMAFTGHTASSAAGWKILRGSTDIAIGDAASNRVRATVGNQIGHQNNDQYHSSAMFLDSPNTTASTTYKLQGICNQGTGFYVNRSSGDGDTTASYRGVSTITVMEIAA